MAVEEAETKGSTLTSAAAVATTAALDGDTSQREAELQPRGAFVPSLGLQRRGARRENTHVSPSRLGVCWIGPCV
jgi:hypothetical protein